MCSCFVLPADETAFVTIGLAEGLDASDPKQGAGEPMLLNRHNILLHDAAPDSGYQPFVKKAQLLLVFLGDRCSAEPRHAEALIFAWRLRKHMRVVFVLPKMDTWVEDRWAVLPPCYLTSCLKGFLCITPAF